MNELVNFNEKNSAMVLGNLDTITEKEKINFYSQVVNCEETIDKILEKPKKIKFVHIDKQRLLKPETPRGYEDAPRLVFYFEDKTSIISFSNGVLNSLKRLVSVFGFPPYDFSIVFKQIQKGKNRIYTIEIIEDVEERKEK